jgi:hypothetical protein
MSPVVCMLLSWSQEIARNKGLTSSTKVKFYSSLKEHTDHFRIFVVENNGLKLFGMCQYHKWHCGRLQVDKRMYFLYIPNTILSRFTACIVTATQITTAHINKKTQNLIPHG